MYQFIDLLKVLAAVLITNSHYANIWPISAMAAGGMLGNVIFFMVSGFGLYRAGYTLKKFFLWYGKRIRRIYVNVWVAVGVTMLLTDKIFDINGLIRAMVYPTDYHFIASIMILYVIFYLLMCLIEAKKISLKKLNTIYIIGVVMVYLLFYDKTWNHIDVVEEPFIRFLFLEAMLLGAQFKQILLEKKTIIFNQERIKIKGLVCTICVGAYFVLKVLISRMPILWSVQILSWITIILAVMSCTCWLGSMEQKLLQLPACAKKIIHIISKRTLQIYLVQYIVIQRFEALVFPLNFVVVTIGILILAEIVYRIDEFVQLKIDSCFKKRITE